MTLASAPYFWRNVGSPQSCSSTSTLSLATGNQSFVIFEFTAFAVADDKGSVASPRVHPVPQPYNDSICHTLCEPSRSHLRLLARVKSNTGTSGKFGAIPQRISFADPRYAWPISSRTRQEASLIRLRNSREVWHYSVTEQVLGGVSAASIAVPKWTGLNTRSLMAGIFARPALLTLVASMGRVSYNPGRLLSSKRLNSHTLLRRGHRWYKLRTS